MEEQDYIYFLSLGNVGPKMLQADLEEVMQKTNPVFQLAMDDLSSL